MYSEMLLNEKYLCAILEGDWKWLELKSWIKICQEYQITGINQEPQPLVKKYLATMLIIYGSQYWAPAKNLIRLKYCEV